jgi:hypothetical protein
MLILKRMSACEKKELGDNIYWGFLEVEKIFFFTSKKGNPDPN